MRLKTVEVHNFRQYKDFKIEFTKPKESDCDLHVIVGKMGVGKTNFIEALNWTLYGKGLFSNISKEDDPNILNNNCLKKNPNHTVYGRLVFDYNEKETLMVIRGVKYTVKDTTAYSLSENELNVTIGSLPISSGIDANKKIQEVLPEDLREHFFFDGEGLDNYFKNTQGEKTRKTIQRMAQIDKIEQFSKLLNDVYNRYFKKTKASEKNALRKKELENELDKIASELESLKSERKILLEQKDRTKKDLTEAQERLDKMKDYENYREKIQLLQEQIQSKLQQKEDKLQEKFHMLVSDGTLIFAWASIDFAFRQNSTFSKSYDFLPQEEIRKALESNKCPICQKELDEEHIKLFGELLNAGETYIMSQERYQELMYNIVNFKYREESINIELGKIEKELKELEEQMGKYQELIRNQDINLFDTLHEERDTLQKALETQSENIGITAENIKKLEQRHKEIEEQIRQLISNDIESKKNLLKADFVKQLSEIINNTVEQRKAQIRKEIERYTMDYLDRLMWKKELIKKVELDEDFTLRVYDESGRIILDRLSGGERSILTLSFAMALHKAVGVNIPIVIDRPLTNISGSSYKEMLEVLSNISKERQIIITLTDREYMDDTVPLLNQKAASINIIDLDQESNVYLKNVK